MGLIRINFIEVVDVLFVKSCFMEHWIIALGEIEDDLFDFGGRIFHF